MKRRDLLQSGAAGLGLSIAGVPLSAVAQGKNSTLNVIVQPEPPGLMLAVTQNAPTQLVAGNIYDGLLRYDEKLTPRPSLAESWSVSTDGLIYTFKIKSGVKWHDGKPFTVEDVVFTFNVFLPKTHARARNNLALVQSISALDERTVEFRLKSPFPSFIGIFEVGSAPLVPKHLYEGTDFATHPANNTPIGTGPYKLKEWVKGSYIQLVANREYHVPGALSIENIYFHVLPDAAARAAAFESGKVDVVPGGAVEFFEVARLAKLPGAMVTTKGWEFFAPQSWLMLNNRVKPLNNAKVRQAIFTGIDRAAIAKVAFQGFAKPATGPFNRHTKYYTDKVTKYPHSIEAAKRLLKEGGYDGETLRLLPLPYGETWQRTAEMVRQHLTQIGMKVQIAATDVAGWNQRTSQWDFDMAFTFLYQYGGDPVLGAARNYTTSNIVKGSPFNNTQGYSNPRVDELFDSGARELDPTKRQAIFEEIQKILVDEVPVSWLLELEFPTLYRTKIDSLISSGVGLNDGLAYAKLRS